MQSVGISDEVSNHMMVVIGFFHHVTSNEVILWMFFMFDEAFLIFYLLVFAPFSFLPLIFILFHVIIFPFIKIGLQREDHEDTLYSCQSVDPESF